jgi:hypothetical protein
LSQGAQKAPGVRAALAVAAIVWGLLLALWLGRVYFLHDAAAVHVNHERYHYASRLLEFRDLLGSGYLAPQWATHFRAGLGSPYFSYYQPGLFYLASLVPWVFAPIRALGVVVVGFAFLGYWGTFSLVRRWFGPLSGLLSGSLLLLSVYAGSEIYVRGDLSELCAMMLLPIAISGLAGWIEEGRLRSAALVAVSTAGITTLHPGIALVASGVLGGIATLFLLSGRLRARAAGALAALAVGVGLSAFYWLPVFGEWNLVTPEAAFTEFYFYAQNFITLSDLFGRYDRSTLIPFTLGPILPLMIVANLVALAIFRERATRVQGAVIAVALATTVGAVFLMTSASALLWEWLPLLQRLQFPWRLQTIAPVFAAALAGATIAWPSERARAALSGVVLVVALFLSVSYTDYRLDARFRNPADVEEVEREYFTPDIRDEWMPRGASTEARRRLGALPTAGPGARIEAFERSQGLLRARVDARRASFVVLPHYAFPIGWSASLAGAPVEIQRDRDGLMKIPLPAGASGRLEVRFGITPMKVAGLWLSTATAIAAGLFALLARRRIPW